MFSLFLTASPWLVARASHDVGLWYFCVVSRLKHKLSRIIHEFFHELRDGLSHAVEPIIYLGAMVGEEVAYEHQGIPYREVGLIVM